MTPNVQAETVTISGEGYKVPQRRRTRARMRNFAGPQRFECAACGGKFVTAQSLYWHVQNYHPEPPENPYAA
jgi:hypothetical protein